MEDLDRPREVPGAAQTLLDTLHALGLEWHGAVIYQSARIDAYEAALSRLADRGLVYPCGCTRSEIAAAGRPGPEGPIYPGTCRNGLPPGREARALRLRTGPEEIGFRDLIQGAQCQDVARAAGDFLLRRADGMPA
jgi:glutamyl-Q tRNA(Asp) synthetase